MSVGPISVLPMLYDHLLQKKQPDYLHPSTELQRVRQQALVAVEKQLPDFSAVLSSPPSFAVQEKDLTRPIVSIGATEELQATEREKIHQQCRFFMPWKKGPYSLFGIGIDSEWRSDLKWQRIENHLGDITGKKIADVGCHNGYFMFRLTADNPAIVVGFEPNLRCYFNFHFMQRFAQVANVYLEPFGVQGLDHYPAYFDLVLCLGILYHHPDPIAILRNIHRSLVTGGRVIIDCQGIAGEESNLLLPRKKYAGASGIWYLPTKTALANWLHRANFRDLNFFYDDWLSPAEQRATVWAPITSLKDFLCPNLQKTVEGYPAPRRIYLGARK